jgi:predicted permease
LVVYILAPALVVDSLYKTEMALDKAIAIMGVFAITSVLLYGLVWLIHRLRPLSSPIHKSVLLAVMLPNNGNIGLPLVAFSLGDQGLERAVIYLIGSSILLFGVMPPLLSNDLNPGNFSQRSQQFLKTSLQLPLSWAIAAGITLRFFQIKLPNNLETTLYQLGQASIVLSLLILGIQLSRTRLALQTFELGILPLRLLIGPAIAFIVARCLQLSGLDLQVVVLQSAMPVAINAVVLAAEFGGDAPKVSRSVVATTVFALITLPIILELMIGQS